MATQCDSITATASQPAADASKPEATRESSPTSVFVNSEPIRADQVQNAVKFLSHPQVMGSPVMYRRSFLERQGLTKEEIDEAFRRVPDPTPSVSGAANEDEKTKSSSTSQPLPVAHNLQSTSALQSNAVTKMGYFSHFRWTHAILAVGTLAASGAGTAVRFMRTVMAWIHKVVVEEEDETGPKKRKPSLAEVVANTAKVDAAVADVLRTNQKIRGLKYGEKGYFEELTNLRNGLNNLKSATQSWKKWK